MSLIENNPCQSPEDTQPLSNSPARKVLIETWGCQMNVADSEQMLAMLKKNNYQPTPDLDDADLVLLNTCHIREKAKHKVMSRLGRIREKQKASQRQIQIAVTGCVAQAEGRKLLEEATNIDVLLGPGKIDQLQDLLDLNQRTGKRQWSIGFKDEHKNQTAPALDKDPEAHQPLLGKSEVSRFINISQGCNNFCTFCVVPFTRGNEISLSPDQVVQKARHLIDSGAQEITLLGQNVNSYGLDLVENKILAASDRGPFVDLLDQIAGLSGLQRLRFTTSNPHDFTRPLADLFATQPKLGRYIHLPVQSGDNEVLRAMRRKVTVAEYLEKVAWLKGVDPEMALSTDLIVGFPGETEEQFQGTLDLVAEVGFSFIYCFMYSPRKGTAATRMTNQVATSVKQERLHRLNDLQNDITESKNKQEIGRVRHVLFHYQSTKEPGVYYGRTEQFRLVRVSAANDLVGQLHPVEITAANRTALVGKLSLLPPTP